MLKKVIYALIIVTWCAIIFFMSNMSANESGSKSKEFLKNVTVFSTAFAYKTHILDHIPSAKSIDRFVNRYHTPFRKACHASEFFVLAMILMFALRKNTSFSLKKSALATLLICFLYSATDEIHQIFVKGRGAAFADCLIDTAGALLAVGIYYLAKIINLELNKKRT